MGCGRVIDDAIGIRARVHCPTVCALVQSLWLSYGLPTVHPAPQVHFIGLSCFLSNFILLNLMTIMELLGAIGTFKLHLTTYHIQTHVPVNH